MLSKEKRLSTKDVTALFSAKRKTVSSVGFRVTVAEQTHFSQTRYACLISKKVASKAVERNKLRRWCYQAIALSSLPSSKRLGVLIYCEKTVKSYSRELFIKELIQLLKKAL